MTNTRTQRAQIHFDIANHSTLHYHYDTITMLLRYMFNIVIVWVVLKETESAAWRTGTGLYEYHEQVMAYNSQKSVPLILRPLGCMNNGVRCWSVDGRCATSKTAARWLSGIRRPVLLPRLQTCRTSLSFATKTNNLTSKTDFRSLGNH